MLFRYYISQHECRKNSTYSHVEEYAWNALYNISSVYCFGIKLKKALGSII